MAIIKARFKRGEPVQLTVEEAVGESCLRATAPYEKLLSKGGKRDYKPEFYETETETEKEQARL